MRFGIFIISLLVALPAYARPLLSTTYSANVFSKEAKSARQLSALYQSSWRFIAYKVEAGMILDTRDKANHQFYTGVGAGLELLFNTVYVAAYNGPTLITPTDAYLGSTLEFMTDLEIGLVDFRRIRLGINFKHLSNAGLWEPNRGKDFLGIKLSIPISLN